MEPRRIKFRHSLQGRLLLFFVLPIVVISVAGIVFRGRRAVELVREQAQRQLENLSGQVAGEVDRGNMRAVLAVQMMALAQEETLFGRRAESSEMARRVLAQYPEFTGAYFGYETNADQQDAAYAGTPKAAEIGPAFSSAGRFIPYWFREQDDPRSIKLEPLVNMETSLYYDGCRKLFNESGKAQPMITEPYVYEGKLIVEQTYPIVKDGEFVGVAGVDRALSDLTDFVEEIKRQRHADVFLISSRGRFIATTVESDLQTKDISETKYRQLFGDFYSERGAAQFKVAADPIDGDDYFFATAHIPTGDWLVVLRESEDHIVGPLYSSVASTSLISGCLLLVILGIAFWFVTSSTGRIRHAMEAAERVAAGDLDRQLSDPRPAADEIGSMFRSLSRVIESYRQVGDVCAAIAAGDFSRTVAPRSARDALAIAINQMADARQLAEANLSAEEERSRLLLESPHEGIIGVDTDGVVTFVNAAGAEMLGYEKSELLGRHLHPLVHHSRVDGAHYPVEECPMHHAFSQGTASTVDDEVLWRKDGGNFAVEYSSVPIHQGGDIVGAVVLFRDITERKLAEAALNQAKEEAENFASQLQRSRSLMQDILDATDAVVYVKDLDGRYLLVNQEWTRVVDRSASSTIGQSDLDIFPEPIAESLVENDRRIIESGEAVRFEETPDGGENPRSFTSNKFPVFDETGKMYAIGGISVDITDQKRAEKALAAAEARSRQLLESAPDGMIIADNDGRIIRVNKQFEALFGYTKKEVIGELIEMLLPDRFRESHVGHRDAFYEQPSPRKMGTGLELFARRKDGTEFPVEISLSPLETEEGLIVSSSIRDITDRKQAEAELIDARGKAEAANQAKADFLANMSHEIRTPMNGIIGMTDLALDTDLDSEQRDYLNTVKESANALLMLLNDILDFSKIEAGKLELEPIDFGLRDALADMLSTLANRAHSKGLELLYDVQPNAQDAVVGDVYRLRQVIINLVGNAIKFTEHGEVIVSVTETQRTDANVTLQFAVRDTGIGIPAERRDAIFQSFEQVDASTTRNFGGTGLGLSISQQLVGLMKGKIWLESELGSGSTFYFTAQFGIGTPQKHGEELSSLLENLPVLVVDDNATNRQILQKMLGNWGMQPTSVESATEALTALDRAANAGKPFRLILSDVNMPNMDGFTFFERTKATEEHRGVPFILLTSASRVGDVARCREIGVSGHLVKPVKQSLLMNAIANTIAEKAAAAVSTTPAEPEKSTEEQRALRILLAEDNEVNQKFAVRALSKAGHQVDVANNGLEAVQSWRDSGYDLILMDLQMPEMDGLQATSRIREIEEAESRSPIPIIAMTANAMKGDRERCLEAGMDGYVSKPVKRQKLFAEIERLMGET